MGFDDTYQWERPVTSVETRRRAIRAIANEAADEAEFRMFLDMLDLDPREGC